MKLAPRLVCVAASLLLVCSICSAGPVPRSHSARRSALTPKTLEKLSRSLKDDKDRLASAAYTRLAALANQSSGVLAARAGLALGYFDYGKGNYTQAQQWFARAKADPLLAEYALYWTAETDMAQGRNADALAELIRFRAQFPDSAMTEQALQSLGNAAIAATQPQAAVAALNSYNLTSQRPALLFLRGEASEQAGKPADAANDYAALYLRFPSSEHAREAGEKLGFLRGTLGSAFPAIPPQKRFEHASILFNANDWMDARDEYASVLPQLSGTAFERAQLRILECGLALGAAPAEISALQIGDADVDAERFYALANYYRGLQQEPQMLAAVESAVSRAPSSPWAEASLFLAGNYYWVQLARDQASSYYQRVEEKFPDSADADPAHWRVAWTAVLKRQPGSAQLLEEHLRRFPGSQFTPDALYWLGRLAEEGQNPARARSFYQKLAERYPHNYFQYLGSARLRALGPGPVQVSDSDLRASAFQVSDLLKTIPPVSDAPKLDGAIPLGAAKRKSKADALRSIAFDASAELELQAAYAATRSPRLLLESAQAAAAAGQYLDAIVAVRRLFPQLDGQPFSDVPHDVWTTAYALPYKDLIHRWSARNALDPMLVAGLIRQESAFQMNARSVSNALGLMQLLPSTARGLAHRSRLRYSQSRLFNPDYNVRLGTTYLSNLMKQFDSVEEALAAYNAGENRVIAWTTGQTYRETAEFVESIPFTQTREYVEIITRNAQIYRRLYGTQHESRTPRKGSGT
jgi:peptidoglycan lytic transglycosylase